MDSSITYMITTDITTREQYLPFVRISMIVQPTQDSVQTYGLAYLNDEFSQNKFLTGFKQISPSTVQGTKYRINISFAGYVHSDRPDYGYGFPINVMAIIYYLNEKGTYEVRKLSQEIRPNP